MNTDEHPLSLSAPRTEDPHEAPPLKWGVLGPGGIANGFATALLAGTRQELVAVGSRVHERARVFAEKFDVANAHGSYEDLVADPDVDVVYIATPHSEHHRHALLALAAGKHVLIEKSLTQDAIQAREIFDVAAERGLFAMEAMWTRFLPHIDVVRQVLDSEKLGRITTVFADHGQIFEYDPQHRMYDPHQAGGALMDLAIYPISFAHFVLGRFSGLTARSEFTATGVDGQTSVIATGPLSAELDGAAENAQAHAVLNSTMFARTPTTAAIVGTKARLELTSAFFAPGPVTLRTNSGQSSIYEPEPHHSSNGLAFEAAELARCVAEGKRESELMPHAESILIMEAMDEIRSQVGLSFPGEAGTQSG